MQISAFGGGKAATMKKTYASPEVAAELLRVEDILADSDELASSSYDPTGDDRNWSWGLLGKRQ